MNRTRIVAILNITPDSFSDGGAYMHPDDALAAIEQFIADGADVIDIGAESTRPGATPLPPEIEWQRLEPILSGLPHMKEVQFSLDSRHAETVRNAIPYGIGWINDVSGFSNRAMLDTARNSECKLVLMHSLSVPADKNIVMPESVDVVQEIIDFAQDRIREMEMAGVLRNRIIFDPGIGFGKTAKQSLAIINQIDQFSVLGIPLMVGHSRKSFLSLTSVDSDVATLAISHELAKHHVSYLRVHDVVAHRHMLNELHIQ